MKNLIDLANQISDPEVKKKEQEIFDMLNKSKNKFFRIFIFKAWKKFVIENSNPLSQK